MDVNAIVDLFRRTVTEHYFDMKGRVGRKEFWWFVAACAVLVIAASILDAIMGAHLLGTLVGLALLLPMAGMGARRLQDTGRNATLVWVALGLNAVVLILGLFTAISGVFGALAFLGVFFLMGGLMVLISLATLVVAIVLIYFWIQPGSPEANPYGPVPPDFDPNKPPAS
jgi:uncharacterized membrane protein YhaH (DUF805 family)